MYIYMCLYNIYIYIYYTNTYMYIYIFGTLLHIRCMYMHPDIFSYFAHICFARLCSAHLSFSLSLSGQQAGHWICIYICICISLCVIKRVFVSLYIMLCVNGGVWVRVWGHSVYVWLCVRSCLIVCYHFVFFPGYVYELVFISIYIYIMYMCVLHGCDPCFSCCSGSWQNLALC